MDVLQEEPGTARPARVVGKVRSAHAGEALQQSWVGLVREFSCMEWASYGRCMTPWPTTYVIPRNLKLGLNSV